MNVEEINESLQFQDSKVLVHADSLSHFRPLVDHAFQPQAQKMLNNRPGHDQKLTGS